MTTYTVSLYMAGDIATASAWLRRECYARGLCVTVTPTSFIYTGGEEGGFVVGFVNYPRFPNTPPDLFNRAKSIALALIVECCQKSALVVGTDRSEWLTIDPPGRQS